MVSIIKIIVGAILRFVWDRADKWYKRELQYQRNKRVLIEEVKNVARDLAEKDLDIARDRESIDDSLLRLDRARNKAESGNSGGGGTPRGIFAGYNASREAGNSDGDSEQQAELPLSDVGSYSGDSTGEQPGIEFMGPGPNDSLSPTQPRMQ